jgi:two-component system KDP operon response regulator KdpE
MVREKIVVMDYDISIIRLITDIFCNENYFVYFVTDCEITIRVINDIQPALVILDILLPEPDGLNLLRSIRESSKVSVIAISDRKEVKYKVKCLEAGADNYLVKPFSNEEFLAQIGALLRRNGNEHEGNSPLKTKQSLEFDFEKRIVTLNGREIYLTPIEYNLLRILAINAEKTLEYQNLLTSVWGSEYVDQWERIHTFISQLRAKIEQDPHHPQYIQTVPRVGYRFHKNGF